MDYYGSFGLLANIAAVVTFCVFVWVTVTLFLAKKKVEKKLRFLEKSEKTGLSKRPAAIVVGIGKNPIVSVEKFLEDNGWEDIPIISWIADGFLQPKDYTKAMAEINDLRSQALNLGVSEVLLFYAGPLDLATFIGSSFSDWVPINVYAFTDSGTYEYRFTLRREGARLCTVSDELVRGLEGKV
jgi:hypothetical protein